MIRSNLKSANELLFVETLTWLKANKKSFNVDRKIVIDLVKKERFELPRAVILDFIEILLAGKISDLDNKNSLSFQSVEVLEDLVSNYPNKKFRLLAAKAIGAQIKKSFSEENLPLHWVRLMKSPYSDVRQYSLTCLLSAKAEGEDELAVLLKLHEKAKDASAKMQIYEACLAVGQGETKTLVKLTQKVLTFDTNPKVLQRAISQAFKSPSEYEGILSDLIPNSFRKDLFSIRTDVLKLIVAATVDDHKKQMAHFNRFLKHKDSSIVLVAINYMQKETRNKQSIFPIEIYDDILAEKLKTPSFLNDRIKGLRSFIRKAAEKSGKVNDEK